MIDTKKAHWTTPGYAVFNTLFFVFCAFFMVDMLCSMQVSRLERRGVKQGMPMTIAPENLASTPELFRLSLKVESRDFPTQEMTKTKAWSELQNAVTAYAQRLQLMQSQERIRSLGTAGLYLLSAIGMSAFAKRARKSDRRKINGEGEGREDSDGLHAS